MLPPQGTTFKGEVQKTGANVEVQNENKNNGTENPPTRVNKNKPFGLKHLAGAALAALGVSLMYCAARTRSAKFNEFLKNAGKILHGLREYVSKRDLIVKDKDLQQFLEGFDGLQSEHIRRGYSSILDVEFTEEQALRLLSKARNGVISIDRKNPIFAKAFLKTSSVIDPPPPEKAAFMADDIRPVIKSPVRIEFGELAGEWKFDRIDDSRAPEYFDIRDKHSEDFKKIFEKKGKRLNFDSTEYERGEVPNRVPRLDVKAAEAAPEAKKDKIPILVSDLSSGQRFENIKFTFDLSKPSVVRDGVAYYKMKNASFNFGRIQETKLKIVIDALEHPIKYAKAVLELPLKGFRKLTGMEAPKKPETPKEAKSEHMLPDLGEFYRDCFPMFKKYKKGRISKEEFSKYIETVNMKPFSIETTTKYSPTALASKSRNFVTLISSYFFINDFRNEVLLQSDGENKEKAHEVTKERVAHKASNFVLNKFFMEVFNNTFNKQYLSSLLGATLVAAATEVTNESSVRASIGVPLHRMESREAIDEYEKKHLEQKGFKGVYYRFMARLTGKKMLSEKAEKK